MKLQQDAQLDHTLERPDVLSSLVLPLESINAQMHELVGGKAANLGELTRAGFPVPQGFCITTTAYTDGAASANLGPLLDELATVPAEDQVQLRNLAASIRVRLEAAPIASSVAEAVAVAYGKLVHNGAIPMAVRSSATAEDLPFASFAGQQDTYLNIVGIGGVLNVVRSCWASLWTERAVSYRVKNGIDHRKVRIAIVVQRMADAAVAGVLFTANPLTGQRYQAVIDANRGLGETVVSGAVNPDHFVVNKDTYQVVERYLGDKQFMIQPIAGGGTQHVTLTSGQDSACLDDEQIARLTRLGVQVENHYGAPQDIEWAIDGQGQPWLLQARPITTLFPLPAGVAASSENMRVYFCFNVLQGVYGPFTPMGFTALRLMASSFAHCLGFTPRDPLAGPSIVVDAGSRLFLDLTPMLHNQKGLAILKKIMGRLEARSGKILQQLATDPRLVPSHTADKGSSRAALVRRALAVGLRTRLPLYLAQVLACPDRALKRVRRLQDELRAQCELPPNATAQERLNAVEQLLLQNPAAITCNILFTALPAFLLTVLAGKIMGDLATPVERQTVLRALPNNPTTEMDLAIWHMAQQIRQDKDVMHLFLETPLEQLAEQYRAGRLPSFLQACLTKFLSLYGHRGVAEIDLGLPRWSEDPTYILGVLANYLHLDNPALAPDVQFQRGEQEAEAMLVELVQRAKQRGRLRSTLVSFCLRRGRKLSGLREAAKFYLVLVLAGARQLLQPVGLELAQVGRLESAEDIYFVTLLEARQALAGANLHTIVRERRADYEREAGRHHVPRLLLSDGTEPEREMHRASEGGKEGKAHALKGIAASAGVVTAKARVVVNPVGAQLEPGEILVAPSTDPGWTPLFLTASGMVMEMGGPMSHGAVVAREYGIPAVVGVPEAIKHIVTGQIITVDGSTGIVQLEAVQPA